MEVFAHVKYVRMSPRKVKLVADMIRGKDVKTATAFLKSTRLKRRNLRSLQLSIYSSANTNYRRYAKRISV